ncbi:Endo-1-3(4)-beta-glucanase [Penicillium bovifimosum]|uniref:Endo-1-3(4)-beta-glucanase n=1 Tax=Penicillium bovifimosum TaxID=126998 RepID=A0A9W9GH13_9EURO|nr:Endo-1-3(4)-beta-glucanase [Penicillium bovifimosum]KAJ5120300.1 Endo-1-3(4)-beta-glucanase [Penicillium bovifimosum]
MKIHILALGAAVIHLGTVTSALPDAQPPSHYPKNRPHGCDCYTVSGPDPGYFQHYKFWDFRAVDLRRHAHPNMSGPVQDNDEDWDNVAPGDHHYGTDPNPNSLVFYKTAFERDWSSQNWKRDGSFISPVVMVNSKSNVFFTRDHERQDPHATYLVMRTTRFSNYTSAAEIETRLRDIYRCSLRVRLRFLPTNFIVSEPAQSQEWPPNNPKRHPRPPPNDHPITVPDGKPSPGACAGIFTYHDLTTESDIEILTRDPSHRVHYANQPDYDFAADEEIPGASTIADLPVPWTNWSTHRLDWQADMSRWFVDGQIQDARSYGVPELQSMIVLNLWSDGGLWTGDMGIGDSVYLGVEYIELAYNRSSDVSRGLYGPFSENHGGHQNVLSADDDDGLEADGKGMCKPGRQGRECRRKKWKKRPRRGFCRRPCNIDEFS